MTYWLLKLHRWLALLFALPLAVLIVTGLILSVEPVCTNSRRHAARHPYGRKN